MAGLASAKLHRLAPHDPEELVADKYRHLAVWPSAEGVEGAQERPEGYTTDGHLLRQQYIVLVWEPSIEGERRKADPAANEAFYDLLDATIDRFYKYANQHLGGSELVWYSGMETAERSGRVRWFRISLMVRRFKGFT